MAADRSMTEREQIAKSVLAYGKALVQIGRAHV